MEHKQFTSDDLGISTESNQGFQVDRFSKKTSQLNIPDTIPENCSAELSGDCLKMEVPKIMVNCLNTDDKENFNCSQRVLCNESLNNSANIEIDNSYIRQCERELLESSNSDDEKKNESRNKSIVNSQLLKISKNFNDTISTPPSLLRKEINLLRTEMAETEEFHDLEIKLLKEEKFLNEMDPESNAELLEKYSTLMELYTNLKTSYEEYRKAQEKMGREFQSKTADCLESLCSQIEASDNSLNFSTASFVSFSGGIRSSTMMEDVSEVEATVIHEATVLANDPLSITCDGTFKTPSQTPARSAKKLFPANYSTGGKPTVKEVKEIIANTTTPLDSEYNIQLLNLETALYDKVTEVRDLEQRLLKIENVSSEMQSEFERISSVYATENKNLKESLSSKTEQLNEIQEKLFTEIISLNPSLKDSLVDVSGKKLLLVFIETIMESCKKLKADNAQATVVDLQDRLASQERKLLELEDMKKLCENLERKLSDAENTVLTRDEEIRMLQSHLGDVRQTREHLASTKEALSELESRLTFEEAEKKAAENRCFELEETIQKLNRDIDASEKLRAELQAQLSSAEKEKSAVANENSRLKELYEAFQLEMTETVEKLKSSESEITAMKESLSSAEVTIEELKSQLKILEEEKSAITNENSGLKELYQALQLEMSESVEKLKSSESEITAIKESLSSGEASVQELKSQLKMLEEEKSAVTNENCRLKELYEALQLEMTDTVEKLKSSESEITAIKESLSSGEASVHELKSQLKILEEEKSAIINENSRLKELQEALQLEMSESVEKLKSSESEIAAIKESLSSGEASVHELKSQLQILEEEKSEVTKENSRLTELYQALQLEMTETVEKLKSSESEITAMKESLSSGDVTIEDLKSQLKILEEEKSEVENENSRLKELYEALQLEMTETVQKLKSSESEISAIKESLSSGEASVQELKSQLKILEEEKSAVTTENSRLTELYQALQLEMAETVEKLKSSESEISEIRERLSSADVTIQDLKSQLKILEEEKSSLQTQCNELQQANQKFLIEVTEVNNQKTETESEALKQKISEYEKTVAQLTEELKSAGENNIRKIEELIREIERLNSDKSELSKALGNVEESQRNLADLLADIENNADSLDERVNKLIENSSGEPADSRDYKIITAFAETLTKTCKGVQNELIRKFESEKHEWETQRELSLHSIKSLKDEVNSLVEKRGEYEAKFSEISLEKEELLKMQENLKKQLAESEKIISTHNNEIRSREDVLKQTQDTLLAADETIKGLKLQLSSAETVQIEIEHRCRELEEIRLNLQADIDAKEVILKEMNEFKAAREMAENENGDLKQKILELEEEIDRLKKCLQVAEEEQNGTERKIKDSQNEIEKLKKETESLMDLTEKLGNLEKSNKCLMDLFAEVRKHLDVPEDALNKILSGDLETCNVFIESINNLVRTQLKAEKEDLEKNQAELEELRTTCCDLELQLSESEKTIVSLETTLKELRNTYSSLETKQETKLSEAEKTISEQEEEIRVLHLHITQTREDFTKTKADLAELESQLEAAKAQKADAENRYRELEGIIEGLNREITEKDNLLSELENQKSEFESENLRLKESFDSLKQQMAETETVISNREEEIRELKTYECELAAARENLASADETILKLKSQLRSVESEKTEMETRCTELQESNQNLRVEVDTAKNLKNNPVYEKIQTENGDLRERILESERQMSELKAELEIAKKDQMNNIYKVEELIREIEDLKRENDGFSCALSTIEETQKNLADVLSHPANDSDLPSDRITKLIEKTRPDSAETRETKIVSDFVETITKTCKGVQNELIKKFDNKKLEWETQKDCDIQNFLEQIKLLNEKNNEKEIALKQSKQELAEADEAILKLKSQLSSTEVEKVEVELRVTKLEEHNLNLQAEIDTKETIIRGMDELKIVRQKIEEENGDLKRKIVESEEVIVRLKKTLEVVKEEQIEKELKIKDSENVIERLKKENAGLTDLTEKLDDLERRNKNLTEFISEVRNHLDISENTMGKVLSGEVETNKIFSEKLNNLIKTQMDGLQSENKHLRLGNDNLKEKVKQLTKLIGETASEAKEELANLNASLSSSISLRSKPSRKSDMCARRLDKLEEINHNLTELINRMLTITEFPEPEKLKLYSVREFPNVMKKVVAHMTDLEEKMKEVKEENAQLDEECETYAKIIKDLKKEAAAVWKTNKDKTEQMEAEISRLKEEKNGLENEKQDLLAKISKLESDCQKMKSSKNEVTTHNCACGNESKKVNELKRTILLKEQKLLELQDLEAQMSSYKAQIDYLKNALEREKKKTGEEKEKNKKLQNELNEATKNQKTEEKKSEENQVLDELRMRGSLSGGVVQEFVDKEKMRKLAKDIGILKELCRARYAEIKRLEALNAALRNGTPKNSNQMDSPIRTRGYNTRSKVQPRDLWKPEAAGKENSVL